MSSTTSLQSLGRFYEPPGISPGRVETSTRRDSGDYWTAVTIDEVNKLISASPNKTCQLDPVTTWLVKEIRELLAPFMRDWMVSTR